jgi:hypothetical protein
VVWLLLTGRGAFRVTSQLATLLLIPVWGATTFSQYANAVGVCSWMLYLSAGAEKAALKLVPRSRRLTANLVRIVLAVSATPLALVLIAFALTPAGSPGRLYLAAAGWAIATGLLMLVAGLHRLCDRARNDAAIFLTLTMAVLGAVGLTWWIDLDPVALLTGLTLTATSLAVGFIFALPRPWLTSTSGRRLGRVVLRSIGLLGAADVLTALSGAACYAALALAGRTEESGSLYVALMICASFGGLLAYLLRVAQPRQSLRQRGGGSAYGRVQAVRYLRVSVLTGVALTVALPVAMLLGTPRTAMLVLLVLVEIPVYAAMSYAVWLLENTDGRILSLTSTSAAAGLVTCAALSALLVPAWGAVGALAALVLSFATQATVLRRAVLARYGTAQVVRSPASTPS